MKTSRNAPCPCDSGKKYKKCCLPKEESKTSLAVPAWSYAEKKSLIKSSDDFPITACLVNPDWKESGLARIVVARRQENGNLIFGVYMTDIFCLGLKNTFCNSDLSPEKFESEIVAKGYMRQEPAPIEISHAKEIIFGAIDYAEKLGFAPDPDFRLSRHVLGSEKPMDDWDIRFGGPDGKPRFIAGPHDDAPRIIQKLRDRLGEDGFHFIARVEVPTGPAINPVGRTPAAGKSLL